MLWCIIVSFNITNSDIKNKLDNLWKKSEKKKYKGRNTNDARAITREQMGGAIALLHPKTLKSIVEIKVRTPHGIVYTSEMGLMVGCDHWIKIIKNGEVAGTLNNPLFNDIHDIFLASDNNLWVCSTGIDALIKINPKKPEIILDSWFATENGYNLSPHGGKRIIRREINHQGIDYHTLDHTTHINSMTEKGSGKILATLFHQGELVEIDLNTGNTKCLISGMKNPHAIRKTSFGYSVSDTGSGKIIFLNKNLKKCSGISINSNWIQDAIELPNNKFLVADNKNGKIICLNNRGEELHAWNYGANRRNISALAMVPISAAQDIFGSSLLSQQIIF